MGAGVEFGHLVGAGKFYRAGSTGGRRFPATAPAWCPCRACQLFFLWRYATMQMLKAKRRKPAGRRELHATCFSIKTQNIIEFFYYTRLELAEFIPMEDKTSRPLILR